MDKVKNYVKNNKKKVIIMSILLVTFIAFVLSLYAIISYLMPNTKKSVYGDRCEVTEGHEVAKDRKKTIKTFLEKYPKFKLVDMEVKCNLIDIIIEIDDSTSVSTVKKMGKELLSVFSKEEVKYYDLQLIINSNNDKSEDYPQIGTHHKEINGKANDDFVW